MLYYESKVLVNPKVSYLECLAKSLNAFLDDEPFKGENLIDRNVEQMIAIIDKAVQIPINEEELRKALLLLEIKAFKHKNLSFDNITPDAVAIIFTFLIDLKRLNKVNNLLDITVGIGNLSMIVSNYSKNAWNLIGIEQDLDLCNYLEAKANFLEKSFDIRCQDNLQFNYRNVDVIVGDLPNYEYENENYHSELYDSGVRNFQYLAIEKHLASGHETTTSYYLVDNDFFTNKDSQKFKDVFSKYGYIKAIIVLPTNFFKGSPKMILVIEKIKENVNKETNIFTLPNYQDQIKWNQALIKIKEYMEEK
jgi:site-specific DNA-methyltransferase (adenine-specific)